MIKELTINGQLFAKYEIEHNILFLKMIIEIVPGNPKISEDILFNIISNCIEKRKFQGVGYLNI